jgi:phosphomannomutase
MTASHLPYTRNGLKFFTKKGGLTSPEVEEICDKAARKYANRVTKVSTMLKSPPTRVDFMSSYAEHLRDIIKERVNHPLHYDTPLQGFRVSLTTLSTSPVFFLCLFVSVFFLCSTT